MVSYLKDVRGQDPGVKGMDRVFVGIPILNRLDLLVECLDMIDVPAEIVIVNNNSIDPDFRSELEDLCRTRGLTALHQSRNLGVAASWNLIIRTAISRGYDWIFIGSNDTRLHPGSLEAALNVPKESDVAVWCLQGHNFFLLSQSTVERVGWFDENFYPAYKEDQDYDYRLRLLGLRQVQVPGAGADHFGSATIASNPDYLNRCQDTHFNWNRNHYIMKWGGDVGEERFTHPYDDSSRDVTWWPDPGETIEIRDWDQVYRSQNLRTLYDRAASDPSGIGSHVPTLYKYASAVRHITEFGSGSGNSTAAFLFAEPDVLISYDLSRDPQINAIRKAAEDKQIEFRFIKANTAEMDDIEPTDLLFIDTPHTYEQLRAELQFADRVHRYLIIHHTETYGIDGQSTDERARNAGLWPAIRELLRRSPEWEIDQIYPNNGGLTILRRC